MNRVTLMGNVGNTPELRTNPKTGNSVLNLRLATNETFKDGSGKVQKRTTWHSVVVWGRQAEAAAKYLGKGDRALIEGRLQVREYEKDGITRQAVEVVASSVTFIERRETPEDAEQPADESHIEA